MPLSRGLQIAMKSIFIINESFEVLFAHFLHLFNSTFFLNYIQTSIIQDNQIISQEKPHIVCEVMPVFASISGYFF